MKSHTVPRMLLDQFAYDDPVTGSRRLWRYEKEKTPRWDASPRTATRIDGHLADPEDAEKERTVEERLSRVIEQPVNGFLFKIAQTGFQLTDEQRRQLTRYVTLLFLRSDARKKASGHTQQVMRHAMNKFLANDNQVLNVAAKWSIDQLLGGVAQTRSVTRADVIGAARKYVLDTDPTSQARKSYVRLIEGAIETVDETLFEGEWRYLRASSDKPFLISDAPVVTWQRNSEGLVSYGAGFHRPDVEVFMPVGPSLCLHILPNVQRTLAIQNPSVDDINAVEAAMSTRFCYTNQNNEAVDRVVQEYAGTAELGVKSFTVWDRNYDNAFYDLLMGNSRWADATRRS